MESFEKTRVIGRKCLIKVSSLHSQTETGKVHWSKYHRAGVFWGCFLFSFAYKVGMVTRLLFNFAIVIIKI